jgi:hypothetical protein
MGLKSILIEQFGIPVVFTALEEKCPEVAIFIDSLDEVTLPVALERALTKRAEIEFGKPIKISEMPIDWIKYIRRFLVEDPALQVILSLLIEMGFVEIAGIDLQSFLTKLCGYEDK